MAELRAGRRNASGEFETLDAVRRDALSHVLGPGPRLPAGAAGGHERLRATECRFRCSAPGSSKRSPIRRCSRSRIRSIATATASAAAPALIIDVETGERRVGRFGWKAQHATLMTFGADAYRNEMGITNDMFPQESAFGITAERMRLCDPFPGSRRHSRSPAPPARHRQLRELHAVPGPVPRVRQRRIRFAAASRSSRRIGCATCHVPALETGPSAESALPPQDGGAVFGPAAPRRRHRRRHQAGRAPKRTKSARRRCGACGSAGRCSTTDTATLEEAILQALRREAELARRGFERLGDADRAALLAFLGSL